MCGKKIPNALPPPHLLSRAHFSRQYPSPALELRPSWDVKIYQPESECLAPPHPPELVHRREQLNCVPASCTKENGPCHSPPRPAWVSLPFGVNRPVLLLEVRAHERQRHVGERRDVQRNDDEHEVVHDRGHVVSEEVGEHVLAGVRACVCV